jgi:N-methylhydantoinase A
MPLDMARAAEALRRLGDELGIGISACAAGILRIVESNMAQAIRHVTMERGIDPRRSALIAFGGAGPLHGAKVAELLGISEVLIPESPGLFSALGVLTAAPSVTLSAPVYQLTPELRPKKLNRTITGLVREARAHYLSENQEEPARVTLSAELRYMGQPEGLMVRCRGGIWQPSILADFERDHRRLYGFNPPVAEIELMNFSVVCAGRLRPLPKVEVSKSLSTPADSRSGIVDRISLEVGRRRRGPLVITQYDSTTYVPSGWTVSLLEDGTLVLAKPDGKAATKP